MSEIPARPIVQLQNVSKCYKMFSGRRQMVAHHFGLRNLPLTRLDPIRDFTALKNVSFTVHQGEKIGVIGRNGAGKSTLLRLISRSTLPSSGSISVRGSLQALLQAGAGFNPELTGRQNIDAALRYAGLYGKAYDAAMHDVLDFVELDHFVDQPFKSYSLGMQARTQFAVATSLTPDVLLIDEILGAGDGYFAAKSAERMKQLVGGRRTLFLVSHDAVSVSRFCERVIWINDGAVHRDGSPESVLSEYEQEMSTLSQAGAAARTSKSSEVNRYDLPIALDTQFVKKQILAAEPAAAYATPIQVDSAPGARRPRHRFLGETKIEITDMTIPSQATDPTGIEVGDSVRFNVSVKAPPGSTANLRLSVLVYSLSGQRIASFTQESESYFDKKGASQLNLSVPKLLLGAHHYIVSLLLENAAEPRYSKAALHDLWSHVAALNFAPTSESDPPLLHLKGWVTAGEGIKTASRIQGNG